MSLGPFLKREMATSVRSARAFSDRRVAIVMVGAIVVGASLLWDRQGWDRSSILGAHRFGLAVFAMLIVSMMILAMGVVVQQVAGSIASERDRKSLDALLASRFSSAEIVLGAVAAGLFRYGNSLASSLPVVVLMVYLGGVAPIWAVLGGLGLASTACLLAGFSVAASIGARTANRAVVAATSVFGAWLALPPMYLLLRPLIWPGSPTWLNSVSASMLQGNPIGLLMSWLGLAPGVGGPVEAVGEMVAWQMAGTLAMLGWSIARLRPASRSLHDVEGEQGRIKRVKAAFRRPPSRPPCHDNPVLWYEVHSTRGMGLARRLERRVIALGWIVAVALGAWWFARPAFVELFQRGYGPSPEAFTAPELHPLMRLLINKRLPSLGVAASPGQARMEFNLVLRLFSCLYALGFVVSIFSAAFESIKAERRRDTWLGLIATPLTALEILRGKTLGAFWRVRLAGVILVGLWTVGLMAGAVHPLGYLASLGFLAISGAFFASLGLFTALVECDPETPEDSSLAAVHLPVVIVASILLTAGPVALAWASLFSYEDLVAVALAGPFPELGEAKIATLMGARSVMVAWLTGAGSLAFGAWWLTRSNERRFDRAVGRPVRALVSERSSWTWLGLRRRPT